MRIEQQQVFTFYFPYEGHEIAIPVRGDNQEQASSKLRAFFLQWGNELVPTTASGGGTLSPIQQRDTPMPQGLTPSTLPSPALELRIEELVKDIIPLKKPKGMNSIEKLIKEWTQVDYSPENYGVIITTLERMRHEGK